MRNSNTMAIAPTATIGCINGVEQSVGKQKTPPKRGFCLYCI